ncbi:hypothetical protein Z043_122577, partial [Scleropages formosus]
AAKKEKIDVRVVFLNLENALGSVLHCLLWVVFRFFKIPESMARLLSKLNDNLKWAKLTVKPSKSRGLLIVDGKVVQEGFYVNGEVIPCIVEKPAKSLGVSQSKRIVVNLLPIGSVNGTTGFVWEGESNVVQEWRCLGRLGKAQDWKLLADLDMVLYFESERIVYFKGLSVKFEDIAGQVVETRDQGWGSVTKSATSLLVEFGVRVKELSEAAENANQWLWMRREK